MKEMRESHIICGKDIIEIWNVVTDIENNADPDPNALTPDSIEIIKDISKAKVI